MGYMMGHQPAFNERLIQEVKKYPSLYNQTKRSFTDTMERMKIWDDIAAAIDPTVSGEFAKKRWLQLRDRYRKELKVAIRQNFAVPQRWCYFSHLCWLDPYLKDNLALTSTPKSEADLSPDTKPDIANFAAVQAMSFEALIRKDKREQSSSFDEPTFDDELLRANVSTALEKVLAATQLLRSESTGPASSSSSSSSTKSSESSEPVQLQRSESGPAILVNGVEACDDNFTRVAKLLPRPYKDWIDDEDMLFARIIGTKLRKMHPRQKKRVKSDIITLLDESDVDDD